MNCIGNQLVSSSKRDWLWVKTLPAHADCSRLYCLVLAANCASVCLN